MSQKTHKVLKYQIVGKDFSRDDPRFCACPQNMEVSALRIMLLDLMQHPEITGYVHDKDATAAKAIRDAGWKFFQYIDPGHGQKSFTRTFEKFNTAHGKLLTEIEDSLLSFFKCLIRTDFSEPTEPETDSDTGSREKVKMYWLNAVNHFCGQHAGCPFTHQPQPAVWIRANQPEAVAALTEFLNKTLHFLDEINAEFSTQMNESFNRGKLKYANKDVRWGHTWEARMACAVLDRNMPRWKQALYDRLGLPPLKPENKLRWQQMEERRLARKEYLLSEESVEAKRQQRRAAKKANAPVKSAGKLDYKPNPYHPIKKA